MASFPTITVNSPAVDVQTANSSLTYQQLISTLYYIAYKVNYIYMQGSNNAQVSTLFSVQQQDADGELFDKPLKRYISPYQYLPIIKYDTRQDDLKIDALTDLIFYMEPDATLTMDFFTDSASFSYRLGEEQLKQTVAIDKKTGDTKDIGIFVMGALLAFLTTAVLLKGKKV